MSIFRINNEAKQARNISKEKMTKLYEVKGKNVRVDFLDASFGELDGKKIPLDESVVTQATKQLLKVFSINETKYNPIPAHIIISNKMIEDNQFNGNSSESDFTISVAEPRYSFYEIYLPAKTKKQIMTALTIQKHNDKLRNQWGLETILKDGRAVILNFFGSPGTGKSMTAEAIAHYLGKQVINVNYAQLESKYVGETPKNIKRYFTEATEKNAILIFDEADSFLGKRLTNVSQSADYGVNVTRSVMLMELEQFTGVVIFTTNLLSNYDQAFKRRIFANIEFTQPDQEAREKIWDIHLPEKLPIKEGITANFLAGKFENITGADIKDIVLYASINCLERGSEVIHLEDF
ncbi:ATP-binding protein [Bacillus massiliigorillae]|uniref:ATP-binding protein n=1 Tax=Bacillus massiliigorillae TaxID=1243664 RepID=UPI00039B97AD|nr:ATP-binding protein [Bacillus massiliigorillae]